MAKKTAGTAATATPRKTEQQRNAEIIGKTRKGIGKAVSTLIASRIRATNNPNAGAALASTWEKFDAELAAVGQPTGDPAQVEAPLSAASE